MQREVHREAPRPADMRLRARQREIDHEAPQTQARAAANATG